MLGNDTMPAMNNNVNSGLKFLGFGGKLRREKKQETKNENKEFPDFIHITKLYPQEEPKKIKFCFVTFVGFIIQYLK